VNRFSLTSGSPNLLGGSGTYQSLMPICGTLTVQDGSSVTNYLDYHPWGGSGTWTNLGDYTANSIWTGRWGVYDTSFDVSITFVGGQGVMEISNASSPAGSGGFGSGALSMGPLSPAENPAYGGGWDLQGAFSVTT
jgi:hypothetical protein